LLLALKWRRNLKKGVAESESCMKAPSCDDRKYSGERNIVGMNGSESFSPHSDYAGMLRRVSWYIQGAYKFSEYFAKPYFHIFLDDKCILCNEIVPTTFRWTSQEDHDVQIAVGTRVGPPQNCNIAQIPENSFFW
jgi:hypothetical protein